KNELDECGQDDSFMSKKIDAMLMKKKDKKNKGFPKNSLDAESTDIKKMLKLK
ncbi:MAG: hypothetical protein MHPSP_004155, partial [Paramarteilia canceri]